MNTDFIELLDIDDITYDNIDVNTYDLTIEDDESFIFSNGIISHNSAAGGIRNNKTDKLGVFPLRGKPLSCLETPLTKILNNKEFKNIRIITGLQIGVPLVEKFDGDWYEILYKNKKYQVNEHDQIFIDDKYIRVSAYEQITKILRQQVDTQKYNELRENKSIIRNLDGLRFGQIVIANDMDRDGFGIRGLLLAFFYKFWPELFTHNVMVILETPIVKVTYKKQLIEFYTLEEFDKWKEENSTARYEATYLKGLASSDNSDWKRYLSKDNLENNLITIEGFSQEDAKVIKLLFSKDKGFANMRKLWLDIE